MVGSTSSKMTHPRQHRSLLAVVKVSTAVVALLSAGLLGLACSNSRVVDNVADAALASGGQAGSIDVPVSAPCGNGKLDPGEECDDGVPPARKLDPNAIPFDDGCNALCQIEVGWQCPVPGQSCIPCDTGTMDVCDAGPPGYCGDGVIQTNLGEMCDMGPLNGVAVDVNGNPVDGGYGNVLCDSRCQIPFCCEP
jgi:hypothetical protein